MKPSLLSVPTSLLNTKHLGAVNITSRQIPVIATTDIIVVGGGCAAAAAALAAGEAGRRVCMIVPRTYFGEDIAGTLNFWLEDGEAPPLGTAPARSWGNERFLRPAQVKMRLQDIVIAAGIEYFYSSLVTQAITGACPERERFFEAMKNAPFPDRLYQMKNAKYYD
jgi:NADPH-dependent 2,4-dienoyl-CoA reductase/sulfur reductase-like enzyme